ncbi:MAG: cytochrome C [Nitrospirota bacterium]
MKKAFLLLMVVALTFALVAIAVSAPINNVTATKHNLSTSGSGSWHSTGDEDQICVFCHTPHQAGTSQDPLWNHTLSTVAAYGVYASNTLNASPAEIAGTNNASLLCMSCHDGTVAVNSLYNPSNDVTDLTSGFANGGSINSNANLGTDLSNDHPVNFSYTAALATADGGLADPGTSGNSMGTFDTDYPGRNLDQVLVPGNSFQCSSCHGPHIYYGGSQAGYAPFLKVDNTGSGLCLSCHIK